MLSEKLSKISDFSSNQELIDINKKITAIQKDILEFDSIQKSFFEIKQNLNLEFCDENEQKTLEDMINEEINILFEKTNNLFLITLLSGEYDNLNAIVSFHSGAGGTESYDFVQMLYRMILRYGENLNFKVIILDQVLDDNGIKSLTIKVCGENAYGLLKSIKGVHRLVRISPFDANKRRHTTFASIEVLPEIENNNDVQICDDELKIDTFRSGGAGGQHVNKTESAVRITHIPTGIVVTCQNERSQIQNKEKAMEVLKNKLYELELQKKEKEMKELKGELSRIDFGSQIRSYVMCPYSMVKDHRTNYETSNVTKVLDGDIDNFINEFLLRGR